MNKLISQCLSMQVGIAAHRSDFSPHGKTQIVQPKNIKGGKFCLPLERVELERDIDKGAFIHDDDVLLKARGSLFTATHIKQAPASAIASSAYFILRPRPDSVLPAFLAWFLNNTRLPIVGSVLQSINLKDLKEMPVSLPSLATQEKITRAYAVAEKERALFEQYHKKVNEQIKAFAIKSITKRSATWR